MAVLEFEHSVDSFEILNPLNEFTRETQRVEVRKDPLLGHVSVYNPLLRDKVKTFIGEVDRELVRKLVSESAEGCFFCPDKTAGLARFPEDFVDGGLITVGQTVLFPNLFTLGKHHSVAAISHAHFLELSGFTPTLVSDAFLAVQEMARRLFRRDADARHVSVNSNYLFPAGASLIHPHFQALVTREPYTQQAQLLRACAEYMARSNHPYAADLIEAEQRSGERYIARTGPWHWLAAYSPLASNEIVAVHESEGDFTRLPEQAVRELGRGLSSTLRLFESLGYLSFNFTLYGRRAPDTDDGFRCLLRCFTRQNPYPNYRTDDFFLQKGLQTELILHPPEFLATRGRPFFAG